MGILCLEDGMNLLENHIARKLDKNELLKQTLEVETPALVAGLLALDAGQPSLDARRQALDAGQPSLDARRLTLDARQPDLDAVLLNNKKTVQKVSFDLLDSSFC